MPEHFRTDSDFHEGDPLAENVPVSEPLAAEVEPEIGRSRHIGLATLSVFVVLFVLLTLTGRIDTLARGIMSALAPTQSGLADAPADIDEAVKEEGDGTFTFRDLDQHPDVVYQPYTAGTLVGDSTSPNIRTILHFRDLMALYEQRQSIDDNFTIRVVDNRTNELLELFTLVNDRDHYRETGNVHWFSIDEKRRVETRRLVDKFAARGVPRPNITVKWGRADQVREARKREVGTIEYEIRLARYLGLSLLPTEVGTVETFNDDRLVSSVGARSRYQMMPYLLRTYGIRQYSLKSAAGNTVPVAEEWNPLLTMESAFITLASYRNAVGAELPGISAYHTGPGNIFNVYRSFLTNRKSQLTPATTVVDAYVWAVTDGYNTVSDGTSFGQYSRGYVASAYGALKAVDNLPIDTSQTYLAERVQLASGKQIYLSQLLRTLDEHRDVLSISPGTGRSLYAVFRKLNPHIDLPAALDSSGAGVPVRGDISLVPTSGGADVRFFLPLGSSSALQQAGVNLLDESETFVYNHDTYSDPLQGEKTMWDREYDLLIHDIAGFGFNTRNLRRLISLEDKFEELAEASPTHYRKMQLDIIRMHLGIWKTGVWEKMASAVSAVEGRLRADPAQPTLLPSISATRTFGASPN